MRKFIRKFHGGCDIIEAKLCNLRSLHLWQTVFDRAKNSYGAFLYQLKIIAYMAKIQKNS